MLRRYQQGTNTRNQVLCGMFHCVCVCECVCMLLHDCQVGCVCVFVAGKRLVLLRGVLDHTWCSSSDCYRVSVWLAGSDRQPNGGAAVCCMGWVLLTVVC